MPTKVKEIDRLERMLGNDVEKTRRDRRAARAIAALREIWMEDPRRRSSDISSLLQGIEWRWPLGIYTPEQLAEKEASLRQMLRERAVNG